MLVMIHVPFEQKQAVASCSFDTKVIEALRDGDDTEWKLVYDALYAQLRKVLAT